MPNIKTTFRSKLPPEAPETIDDVVIIPSIPPYTNSDKYDINFASNSYYILCTTFIFVLFLFQLYIN